VTGTAWVSGTVGPDGPKIDRVYPADPRNVLPAVSPGSTVLVRATDAAGADLGTVPADVELLVGGTQGTGTFTAPVPAGAAAVEARSPGRRPTPTPGTGCRPASSTPPTAGRGAPSTWGPTGVRRRSPPRGCPRPARHASA
jgi:hypothetical protein